MQFSTDFILDREHFSECYDQSALITPPKKIRYQFIGALLLVGFLMMMFTEQSVAVGLFFISLAFVEFFSFQYRKAWWLSRQMWSKNSGNKITLLMDDSAIKITSIYQNQHFNWDEIKELIETPKGIILMLNNNAQSYLSKSSLSDEMVNFMKLKLDQHSS